MFNSILPYYDRDGYYTYDQVMEAFNYVKVADPTDDQYHKHSLYDHLKEIRENDGTYHMDIILARDDRYDELYSCNRWGL